jgi:putative hemolysin
MQKLKLLILVSLILWQSLSFADCKITTWKADGKSFDTCYDEKLDIVLSASCVADKNCGAREFLNKVEDLVLKPTKEQASQNPGSIYCKWLNGKVILGRNERSSQNAFCQAKDGTIVNLSGLAGRTSEAKAK